MLRGTAWLPGVGFVWRTGAHWAEFYLPFLSAACTTFTCRLGEGAAEGGEGLQLLGLWGPAVEDWPCRTAASLAQAQPVLAALQTPNELSSVRLGR